MEFWLNQSSVKRCVQNIWKEIISFERTPFLVQNMNCFKRCFVKVNKWVWFQRNCSAAPVGSEARKFAVSSTELIKCISHRRETEKLMLWTLALRLRFALTEENVWFWISLRWPIYLINLVNKTKFSFFVEMASLATLRVYHSGRYTWLNIGSTDQGCRKR